MSLAARHALIVAAISFLSNLPLGYLRWGPRKRMRSVAKRSPEWWKAFAGLMLYIHLSIPIVAGLRRYWHLQPWYWYVPAFVALALLAQAIGERMRKMS